MTQHVLEVECNICGEQAEFRGDREQVYANKAKFDEEHKHGKGYGGTGWIERQE